MFAVGFVLSSMTGIYLTNVLPTTAVGLRLPWYYPFTKHYWCGAPARHRASRLSAADLSFEDDSFDFDDNEHEHNDDNDDKENR